jgi:prevent-host-death family protein
MRKVTATELQRNAREIIDQVRVRHEAVVVENRGKPMVAVVPYEQYLREQQRRDEDFRRLFEMVDANAAVNSHMTEEDAMALAKEMIQEVRQERRRGPSA